MNNLEGNLAKIKEAMKVGMNGNDLLADDLLWCVGALSGVPRSPQGALDRYFSRFGVCFFVTL